MENTEDREVSEDEQGFTVLLLTLFSGDGALFSGDTPEGKEHGVSYVLLVVGSSLKSTNRLKRLLIYNRSCGLFYYNVFKAWSFNLSIVSLKECFEGWKWRKITAGSLAANNQRNGSGLGLSSKLYTSDMNCILPNPRIRRFSPIRIRRNQVNNRKEVDKFLVICQVLGEEKDRGERNMDFEAEEQREGY
ncbi:unnamed protein product [Lactuca saligna]|uniref:Uncharacterized protein n=1 Tax=Lactuca saligna TaxID=75948 RepID=A0AA35ZYD7_LACSI|nr:unnamed protein product [Lactuca saligna]